MIRIGPVSIALLGRIGLRAIFVLSLPAAAHAACEQWDVRGKWTIKQTNGFSVIFQLEQTGAELQGKAGDASPQGDCVLTATCPLFSGSVDGTIKGNSFDLNVYWNGGAIGVYTGKVGPQGRIEGSTYDKMDPSSTANWRSDTTVKCLTIATSTISAPLVSEKPVHSLGRVKESGTVPVAPLSICESARNARARNSPAAPGLERQCRRFLDTPVAPVLEP